MTPYMIPITQGETFFQEIIVEDDDGVAVDVSTATKSIKCSNGLDADDFTLADGSETGSIEIRSDHVKTTNWILGVFTATVWLDWGASADIEKEPIFPMTIPVKAAE